jgi:hypothetical protein
MEERATSSQLLANIWYSDAGLLKPLVTLALDDAITTDAVRGRSLGIKAGQMRQGELFTCLLEALGLSWEVRNLIG